jgi:hypothetical protein
MFYVEEVRMGGSGLQVTFTNPYDAYHLLGKAFWCGCEFIYFTICNIFTQRDYIFPTANNMHCLPTSSPTRTRSEGYLQLEPKMCCR